MTAVHRLAYAAAHVVMRDSYREVDHAPDRPGSPEEIAAHIDHDATRTVRVRLDALGFGIAEAMDTAQRFAIGWHNASRLIADCGALRPKRGFVAGAGVDQRDSVDGEDEIVAAVVELVEFIQEHGGIPILLPIVALPHRGANADDYVRVYEAIVARCEGPLLVHWLGEMFLPALRGYFPGDSFDRVMALDPAKVRGCKLSLLDAELERRVRRGLLPRQQVVLTGDDFHFAEMIRGDASEVTGTTRIGDIEVALGDFSHALLGVLDAVAEPASRALTALEGGDSAAFDAIMAPCEELGRHLFATPTSAYKTGIAFLAWLGGHQDNPMLVNHEERLRDRAHLERCIELAEAAGVLDASARALIDRFRAETL